MRLRSKDGIEMMAVKSIERDGDGIVVKGKMMGAMAATIIVTPNDVWEAFKLFPRDMILRLPVLLYKGWQSSRKKT